MKQHTEPEIANATHRFTRRSAIGAVTGLALAGSLGTLAAQSDATPGASPVSGEWTFTDDKGVTVTLPEAPKRIVADINAAAPLWDFGVRPVAVFGWNANDSGDFGAAGGRVDPAQVEVVGDAATPIDIEKLVAVQPDLIITISWTPDDPNDYWSIDQGILEQVKQVAPIIALSANDRADITVERFGELASALGADVEASASATDKQRYDEASAALRELTASMSDVTSTFIWAGQDVLYVAVPEAWGDLLLFQELGLNIVTPEAPSMVFWDELGWEGAMMYPSDIVFNSWRSELSDDQLKEHPTMGAHPAIAAGQIGDWNQDFIMSYSGLADTIQAVIDTLEPAQKVL